MRKYVSFFCVFVYFASLIAGYYFEIKYYYNEAEVVLDKLHYSNSAELFFHIVKNNLLVIAINISGLLSFGIISIINLIYNGFVFGVILNSALEEFTTDKVLSVVLPHSFELAGIIWSSAIGVYLGLQLLFSSIKHDAKMKIESKDMKETFFCIVIIIFAAFIESYVSIK